MSEKGQIDKLFQEALQKEMQFSDAEKQWEKLNKRLQQPASNRKYNFIWFLAGILCIGAFSGYFLLHNGAVSITDNTLTNTVSSNDVNKANAIIVSDEENDMADAVTKSIKLDDINQTNENDDVTAQPTKSSKTPMEVDPAIPAQAGLVTKSDYELSLDGTTKEEKSLKNTYEQKVTSYTENNSYSNQQSVINDYYGISDSETIKSGAYSTNNNYENSTAQSSENVTEKRGYNNNVSVNNKLVNGSTVNPYGLSTNVNENKAESVAGDPNSSFVSFEKISILSITKLKTSATLDVNPQKINPITVETPTKKLRRFSLGVGLYKELYINGVEVINESITPSVQLAYRLSPRWNVSMELSRYTVNRQILSSWEKYNIQEYGSYDLQDFMGVDIRQKNWNVEIGASYKMFALSSLQFHALAGGLIHAQNGTSTYIFATPYAVTYEYEEFDGKSVYLDDLYAGIKMEYFITNTFSAGITGKYYSPINRRTYNWDNRIRIGLSVGKLF